LRISVSDEDVVTLLFIGGGAKFTKSTSNKHRDKMLNRVANSSVVIDHELEEDKKPGESEPPRIDLGVNLIDGLLLRDFEKAYTIPTRASNLQ
jgi:hypothetical protein